MVRGVEDGEESCDEIKCECGRGPKSKEMRNEK